MAYRIFSDWLYRTLESKGIPAKELSLKIGGNPKLVNNWLCGIVVPLRSKVFDIAKELEIDHMEIERLIMEDVKHGKV